MRIASITEAKNGLSALIDIVRTGETVLIVDRGRPVARLESAISEAIAPGGRLARLERTGLIKVASSAAMPKSKFSKRPKLRRGASGVQALLDERREGR